jgi:hypothetical protein
MSEKVTTEKQGNITPYPERCGAREKAFGGSFRSPIVIGVRN